MSKIKNECTSCQVKSVQSHIDRMHSVLSGIFASCRPNWRSWTCPQKIGRILKAQSLSTQKVISHPTPFWHSLIFLGSILCLLFPWQQISDVSNVGQDRPFIFKILPLRGNFCQILVRECSGLVFTNYIFGPGNQVTLGFLCTWSWCKEQFWVCR